MDNKNKNKPTGKKEEKKVLKVTLKVLKIMLVLGVLVGFLGGGIALGMVAAALQSVPELNRDQLENPSLPTIVLDRHGGFIGEALDVNRVWLSYDEIPEDLKNAFIATEDNNFYDHPGFDIRGMGRAAITNLQGNSVSGGSTITQQTAKQIFLHQQKAMDRKIQELYLALQIEKLYTKQEIMEFYLNSAVVYGHDEHGVGAAARALFNKSVDELTLSEMALLAGIPNWPSWYDPRRGSDAEAQMQRATMRRNHVLSRMLRFGYITQEQYDEAIAEEIVLNSGSIDSESGRDSTRGIRYAGPYNYALLAAEDVLMDLFEYDRAEAQHAIRNHGYTITTTVDLEKQRTAESVVNDDSNFTRHVERNARGNPYRGTGLQEEASAVLIDNKTGEILALVSGRNAHFRDNANLRPVRSPRPVGSAIKPILSYAPAMENRLLFPGSVVDDAPKIFGDYTPSNFPGVGFNGLVTVRQSLYRSWNIPAVVATQKAGLPTSVDFANSLGLSGYTRENVIGDRRANLSATLGSVGVTNLEITSAYSAFANNGVLVEHNFIKEIVDRHGRVIYTSNPESKVVMSEETAFLMTNMMEDVLSPAGTASAVRTRAGFTKAAAAKSGTSDGSLDSWIVGYSPHYSLGVWVGWDKNENPVPSGIVRDLWGKIMNGVHSDLPNTPFPSAPRDVVRLEVSTKSGKLPGPLTPSEYIRADYFVRGYEPTEICDAFVEVTICRESGLLATDSCPPHHRQTKVMLAPREYIVTTSEWGAGPGLKPKDVAMMAPTEECDMHDGSGSSANPTNLASSFASNGIRLTWSASDDVRGFNVYRQEPGEDFERLNSTPINVREFLDSSAQKDIEYTYYVTAITRDRDETRGSNRITVTLPSTVQSVNDFEISLRNNRVELNWEPALNASQYKIYRNTEEGSGFSLIEQTSRTSFVDRNVEPGTTYFYYIIADDADPSPTKSITVPSRGNNGNDDNGDDDGNEDNDDDQGGTEGQDDNGN